MKYEIPKTLFGIIEHKDNFSPYVKLHKSLLVFIFEKKIIHMGVISSNTDQKCFII